MIATAVDGQPEGRSVRPGPDLVGEPRRPAERPEPERRPQPPTERGDPPVNLRRWLDRRG